nr:immunoglobulin light chain junction region [Macaca mulatta]MPN98113.1 immunoglobulin light chain junction region [Macaca mulatta]
CLQYSNSPCTF